VKHYVKKLIREPLVHFLLIGAGLFLLFGWKGNPASVPGRQAGPQSSKIVVTQGDIEQMHAVFRKTWQRPPTEEESKGIVEDFVRNEIYYREALAIGLDRGDALLKRRLRQKMEFIFEDLTARVEPTDEDLRTYMKEHPEAYHVDPQIAFRQVYINADKREKTAETYARQILADLDGGADRDLAGDPSLLEPEVRLSPLWDIRKQFGEEFSRSLLELKPERWEGPVRSTYGLHLVFVTKREEGRLPELKEVREMVKRDWMAERQKELKDAAYAKIRERYTVEIEKPKAGADPAVAYAATKTVTR
jgi:parvulin-like peptidyl-prolyl isomerase